MRTYHRRPALVRAEINAGLQEYEDMRRDIELEEIEHRRVARCGTIVGEPHVWFFRSLVSVVHGRIPDLVRFTPVTQHSLMLH